jgi:glycine/D-amino acid oxidase-like deaminating enzyme
MRLYHPDTYRRALPIGSYWETTVEPVSTAALTQTESCEVAIIGGGLTGLSAAWHLLKAGIEAIVLEAGVSGWGASGRNGGFCCVGATGLDGEQLVRRYGEVETRRFYQDQRKAVELVRDFSTTIDLDAQGNGELKVAHHPSYRPDLETELAFFQTVAQYPCALWSQAELAERGFVSPEAVTALHLGVGFGLNPLKLTTGLAKALLQRGGQIYSHSPVVAWEQANGWHRLHTPQGQIRAKRVVIATNGYTEDKLHPRLAGCFLPVLSQIITTRPLSEVELAAQQWQTETPIYDTHQPLFYYRLLPDRRLLFGSRGGTQGSLAERDRHQHWMQMRLGQLFPAWKDIEITQVWNGLVCFSASLTPAIGQFADDPSLYYGLAYHGSGVATATWTGQILAELIAGRPPQNLSAVYQPPKPFPLPALRLWALRFAYWKYGLEDAWRTQAIFNFPRS